MGSEAKIREWGVLIGWCPLDCYDYYRVSKNWVLSPPSKDEGMLPFSIPILVYHPPSTIQCISSLVQNLFVCTLSIGFPRYIVPKGGAASPTPPPPPPIYFEFFRTIASSDLIWSHPHIYSHIHPGLTATLTAPDLEIDYRGHHGRRNKDIFWGLLLHFFPSPPQPQRGPGPPSSFPPLPLSNYPSTFLFLISPTPKGRPPTQPLPIFPSSSAPQLRLLIYYSDFNAPLQLSFENISTISI